MTRRELIDAALALMILPAATGTADAKTARRDAPIPTRKLGRTGAQVSCIGLGGHHIGTQATEQESIRIIRSAVDRGITFLDNCWDYNDGKSEARMGNALADGYRKKVFLMTKIDGRDAKTAAKQIDESLGRLKTDHLDLLQLHEIIHADDPQRTFKQGGAIEAMVAAQKAGKARFLGFTGHKSPAMHLAMLAAAKKHGFRFDAVQLPLNVMDAQFDSFEKQVLPQLLKDGIGVLGMKPMGAGVLLESKVVTAQECLRYALSLPASVVITGMDSPERVEQAAKVAAGVRPADEAYLNALLEKTKAAAQAGRFERYKTTQDFDGTVHHPEWLG